MQRGVDDGMTQRGSVCLSFRSGLEYLLAGVLSDLDSRCGNFAWPNPMME